MCLYPVEGLAWAEEMLHDHRIGFASPKSVEINHQDDFQNLSMSRTASEARNHGGSGLKIS